MEDESVISKGITGKFENKGVEWLTKYTSKDENAVRLKMTKLSNGQILVLFEKWTGHKFVSSHLMTLDQNGKITRSSRTTKFPFRMLMVDEIVGTDKNTAVFYTGAKGKLVRYEVSLVSGPGSGPAKAPVAITQTPITNPPWAIAPTKGSGICGGLGEGERERVMVRMTVIMRLLPERSRNHTRNRLKLRLESPLIMLWGLDIFS